LTHPTVGRRIAALGRQFDAPLFLRENNVCIPTATCARLITAAANMEKEVLSEGSSLKDQSVRAAGPVRLVSVPWVQNEVLLPAIQELHRAHGGLSLRLQDSLDDTPFPADEPVIALRFELPPGRGDTVIPLARIGYAVFGPKGPSARADLPWVSFRGRCRWIGCARNAYRTKT
jgi:DNA-binding transcriptional LysR family regulator